MISGWPYLSVIQRSKERSPKGATLSQEELDLHNIQNSKLRASKVDKIPTQLVNEHFLCIPTTEYKEKGTYSYQDGSKDVAISLSAS